MKASPTVAAFVSARKADEIEVVETALPVEVGGVERMFQAFAFEGAREDEQLLVLVHREANAEDVVPIVRVHSGCVTGDIFHSLRCDCYQQLQACLDIILDSPFGAVVYLPYQEGRGIGLFKKLQAYALQERGIDTVDANTAIGAPVDARDYDLAAHALAHLELTEIRLLTNNPAKEQALAARGIRVVERLPIVGDANKHNKRYLLTKRDRMGHDL